MKRTTPSRARKSTTPAGEKPSRSTQSARSRVTRPRVINPGRAQLACIEAVSQRLQAHEPLTLVTGLPGSGRSLLADRCLKLARNGERLDGATLDRGTLMAALARNLAISLRDDTDESLEPLLGKLSQVRRRARMARPIVIDDAEQMAPDALTLIAQLSMLQPAQDGRLAFVLIGTPILNAMLASLIRSGCALRYRSLPLSGLRLDETRALALQVLGGPRGMTQPPSSAFLLTLHLLARGRPARIRELLGRFGQPLKTSDALSVRSLLQHASLRPGSRAWTRLIRLLRHLADRTPRLLDRRPSARSMGWASAAASLALGVAIGLYAPSMLVHEVRAAAVPAAIAADDNRLVVAPAQVLKLETASPTATPAAATVSDATIDPDFAANVDLPTFDSVPAMAMDDVPMAAPESAFDLANRSITTNNIDTETLLDRPATSTIGAALPSRAATAASAAGPHKRAALKRPVHTVKLVARLAQATPDTRSDAGPHSDATLVQIRMPSTAADLPESRPPVMRSMPSSIAPTIIQPIAQPVSQPVEQATAQTNTQAPPQATTPYALAPMAQAPSAKAAADATPRTNTPTDAPVAKPLPISRPAQVDSRVEKRARTGNDDLVRAGDAIATGRNTEALQLLRKILAENPLNLEARASLIAVLGERGRDDEWLEALAQAAATSTDQFGLAAISAHLEQGRLDDARNLILRMPERLRDARLNGLAGVLYTKLQQYPDALTAYDQAIADTPQTSPRHRSLQLARAVVLEHLGRFDEAREVYRATLDADAPSSAMTFARSRLAQLELPR